MNNLWEGIYHIRDHILDPDDANQIVDALIDFAGEHQADEGDLLVITKEAVFAAIHVGVTPAINRYFI